MAFVKLTVAQMREEARQLRALANEVGTDTVQLRLDAGEWDELADEAERR